MDISPGLYTHLLDFEILSHTDIFDRRGCILVNDISKYDKTRIWGKVCESPFGCLRLIDQLGYQGFKQSGQEVLFEANDMMETLLRSTTVLLFDYELTAGRGEFPMNAIHLRPTAKSFLVPWDGKDDSTQWMIDLFAGGYGGWTYALQFLTDDPQQWFGQTAYTKRHVIAVEQDIPAAASHAHNHKMHLVPDEYLAHDWFCRFPHATVINAPIQAHHWKQPVAMLAADLWTISHPCQSWTNAAHSKGFEDPNGLAFASALGIIRVFRPKYVALENVKNFQDHCQFPLVQQLIRWAGYRILHQGVYDVSQHLPVKRPRYLAILQRVEETRDDFVWQTWKSVPNIVPHVWDAWTPTPIHEFQQFTLSQEAKNMYLDPKFLPKGSSSKFKYDMMTFRVPPSSEKLPVFMAAYGSHHYIPLYLLQNKGMHGFFTREQGTIRWFKPEEILMLHSHVYTSTLLKPAELSWKFLGNSITMHHGVLALANILGHQFGIKAPQEFHSIFDTLDHQRLRASTSMTVSDEYAWYIGDQTQIMKQQSDIRFLSHQMKWTGDPSPKWPEGLFFHTEHGLQQLMEELPSVLNQIVPATVEDSSDDENIESPESVKLCDITIAASPGTYGILHFEDLWQWSDIHELWGDNFQPYSVDGIFIDSNSVPSKAILMPTEDDQSICVPDNKRHGIFWDDEQGTHCLLVVHEIKWKDVQRDHPILDDYCYDDYGKIPPEMMIRKSLKVMIEPHMIQPFPELAQFVPSFAEVGTIAIIPSHTDILAVVFTGPTSALIQVITFWQYALNDKWLEQHHRQMCFQVETNFKARLIFRPTGDGFSTPTSILQNSIQVQLVKTVFESFHCTDAQAVVQIQFENRYVSEIALPRDQTFAEFYGLCQHVTLFSNNGLTPALLVGLKRVGDDVTIGKLVDHYGLTFRCIIGQTLVGGTNKSSHKQSIQASLASILIEHGVKIEDVSKHVQTIIRQVGIPKLTQTLFVETDQDKSDQIETIIEECHIPRNAKTVKVASSKAKYTKIALDQQMKHSRNIDVGQYKLIPGFFNRSNGEPMPIQSTFSPCISGITMMPAANAEQWLMHKGKIIPEEMALFLIGDLNEEQQQKTSKVVAPAYNTAGDQVLLAGWLLQLGESQVQLSTHDTPKVQTLDVQVCSFTLWATDFTKEQWQDIIKSPVKQTKLILDKDQLGEVIKNPWGRTFRQGKIPCANTEATSVQFHSEIMIRDLRRLLHRSGFNRVYVTPKDIGGSPSADWRVIWTSETVQSLEAQTMSQPGAAGLVKGNKNHGLRVEHSAFSQIWNLLHPGEEPPKQIPKGNLWRLHPLPYGVDKQVMQEWAENVGWTCFPLRPLGAKAWLMQSQQPPPNKLLSFNGQPLIIKSLPSKVDNITSGLIAGPKSKPNPDSKSSQGNIFRTGDPFQDAWAAWQPTSQKTAKDQSVSEATPGPTTAHLQMHDQQLHTLEQAIKHLEEAHKEKDIQDAAKFASLEESIVQNQQQVQGAFQTLRTDFQSSLSQAITQQDAKLSQGFEELKDLFRQREKRRKPERSDEMESSEWTLRWAILN